MKDTRLYYSIALGRENQLSNMYQEIFAILNNYSVYRFYGGSG